MHAIELEEYRPASFARGELPESVVDQLWPTYRKEIQIEWPNPATEFNYRLTSQGTVGYIPLEDTTITLKPKVPVANLFRMLEYAYQVKSFQFLEGDVDTESLRDVYERLAAVLAKRVLDRSRRGLYRDYLNRSENLSFLRGRLDVERAIRRPWAVRPYCHYQDHTSDVEDNQILNWTLRGLARGGLIRNVVRSTVASAHRRLRTNVASVPFRSGDCVGRRYNRLNEDYEVLHGLCRFFLDHAGPGLNQGDHTMMPFILEMSRLFESFVAAWLEKNLPAGLSLDPQARVSLTDTTYFDIDLVIYDEDRGGLKQARMVLDTKYKYPDKPATSDIEQVLAYALSKECSEAFLVYPAPLREPLDAVVGNRVRVRSVTFDTGMDVEDAGRDFLHSIISSDN